MFTAPVMIPVGIAHRAQVIERRMQLADQLLTPGTRQWRRPGKVPEPALSERLQYLVVEPVVGPEPHRIQDVVVPHRVRDATATSSRTRPCAGGDGRPARRFRAGRIPRRHPVAAGSPRGRPRRSRAGRPRGLKAMTDQWTEHKQRVTAARLAWCDGHEPVPAEVPSWPKES